MVRLNDDLSPQNFPITKYYRIKKTNRQSGLYKILHICTKSRFAVSTNLFRAICKSVNGHTFGPDTTDESADKSSLNGTDAIKKRLPRHEHFQFHQFYQLKRRRLCSFAKSLGATYCREKGSAPESQFPILIRTQALFSDLPLAFIWLLCSRTTSPIPAPV
jgi:hypothetical protein